MSQEPARLRLELAPRLAEIDRVVEAFESFAGTAGLDGETTQQVTLVLDELFSNVTSYGGIEDERASILLDITIDAGDLKIEMSDPGRPFDPRTVPTPDIEASLDERQVGGLGVHFARTLMDSLDYRHDGGRNHVTLRKRVHGTSR